MEDIILAIIRDLTLPAALVMLALIAAPVLAFIFYVTVKPNKLSHRENMAKLENERDANMLKINREQPKQIIEASPDRQRDENYRHSD